MHARPWLRPLLLASLVILTFPLPAAVYKWVDENGKVHYGSKPPSGKQATEIRTPAATESQPAPASDLQRKSRRKKILEAYEAERQEKREAKAKEQAEQQKVAERCAKARDWLKREDGAPSLYKKDEAGNRQYLSTEDRTELVKKMRTYVRKHC
ncbi:MAG: DUF4124 domain-containing protein [Pseudomonadota bacterium]